MKEEKECLFFSALYTRYVHGKQQIEKEKPCRKKKRIDLLNINIYDETKERLDSMFYFFLLNISMIKPLMILFNRFYLTNKKNPKNHVHLINSIHLKYIL